MGKKTVPPPTKKGSSNNKKVTSVAVNLKAKSVQQTNRDRSKAKPKPNARNPVKSKGKTSAPAAATSVNKRKAIAPQKTSVGNGALSANGKKEVPVKRSGTPKVNGQQKTSVAPVTSSGTQPPQPKTSSAATGSTVRSCAAAAKVRTDNNKSSGATAKPSNDKSLLNIPHEIRINGFSSLLNAAKKSTPRVQQLLLNECDLIMECRFCRNLFRSLPNFISHKLNYCKTIFHSTSENGCSKFLQNSGKAASSEVNYCYTFHPSVQGGSSVSSVLVSGEEEQEHVADGGDAVEPAQLIDSATQSPGSMYKNIQELNEEVENGAERSASVQMSIKPVENRSDIMYQTPVVADGTASAFSNDPYDNREVVNRDTAILGPDGKVICTGTARGIEKIVRHLTVQIDLAQRRMVQNGANPYPETCDICKTVFTSEKAFRQHRRDAPDCVKQSSSWGNGTRNEMTNHSSGTVETTTPKKVKAENEQFVKQLFSRSPLIGNPLSKLSPYKRTVGKAVKNLQGSSAFQRPASGKALELKFPCTKCSKRFPSMNEMQLHLGGPECLNYYNRLQSQTPRITIESRHNYNKKSPTTSDEVQDAENSNDGSDFETKKQANSCADVEVDVNDNVAGGKTHKGVFANILDEASEQSVEESVPQQETDNHDFQAGIDPFSSCTTMEDMGPKNTNADSDIDRNSNMTDSGISSESGAPEDIGTATEEESLSQEVLEHMQKVVHIDNCDRENPVRKRPKLTDERVLVPKNKNLKSSPTKTIAISAKRTSVRQKAPTTKITNRFLASKAK